MRGCVVMDMEGGCCSSEASLGGICADLESFWLSADGGVKIPEHEHHDDHSPSS